MSVSTLSVDKVTAATAGAPFVIRTDRLAKLLVVLIPVLLAARAIGAQIDDESYLDYFANTSYWLDFGLANPLSLIVNEPLFLLYGLAINDPELAFRVVIFMGAVLAGIGVGRLSNWSLSGVALYFFSPLSLVVHVVHIRQGFAIGCYYFFLSCEGKVRWLRFLTPLIHSSFWIVIGMEFMCHLLFRRKQDIAAYWHLTSLAIGVAMSVSFSLMVFWVASSFGFRQADEYNFGQIDGSGLGLMFWLAITPLLIIGARTFQHSFFCMFLGFYLGGYFMNPLSARIFVDAYPLLYADGYRRPWGSVLALAMFAFSVLLIFKTEFYLRLFG